MPTLSMFYGIIVRMYHEAGGQHHFPHSHATFSGDEVVVKLDGTIIEGRIAPSKMKLLLAWLEIHHDELEANWTLISAGEPYFKIEPLR